MNTVLEGRCRALRPLDPAANRKATSRTMWMITPDRLLSATPVRATGVSTPDFCRNRMLTAYPPADAGVIRLVNEDASWAAKVGPSRSGRGMAPTMLIVAPMYVTTEQATAAAIQTGLACCIRSTTPPTLASCGYRK